MSMDHFCEIAYTLSRTESFARSRPETLKEKTRYPAWSDSDLALLCASERLEHYDKALQQKELETLIFDSKQFVRTCA